MDSALCQLSPAYLGLLLRYQKALAQRGIRLVLADLDNTLVPSSQEETEETMRGLITLLEKGTENPSGSLNFLLTL